MEDRLALIETRLSKIEDHLGLAAQKSVTAPTDEPGTPTESLAVQQHSPPPVVMRVERPRNWLGVVTVLCFVLAAAGFFVKLSVESGGLTPVWQIDLAALLGFSLIGIGFTSMKSGRKYAHLLPCAGTVVLYLTTFVAHSYYSLLSFESAIAVVSLASGLCIWLYSADE